MMPSHSVQNALQNEAQTYSGRRSDYDLDKDAWAKQMQFSSMDCLLDPTVTSPTYTSFAGIKKNFRRYLNMKKLKERRPDWSPDALKELFVRYRHLISSRRQEDAKYFMRLTTHSEAARLEKEMQTRLNTEFKEKSWKSMKMATGAGSGMKMKMSSSFTNAPSNTPKPAAAAANVPAGVDEHALSNWASVNPAMLRIELKDHYDIIIKDFSLVSTYMAQMSNEDWMQLTYKAEYFEKTEDGVLSKKEAEEKALSDERRKLQEEGKKASAAADGSTGEESAAGDDEKALLDKGYKKVVEYPVFEVRLGDGVKVTSLFPFVIVGVMRKDGTRFGRDAQDATNLRKQFDRSSKWW